VTADSITIRPAQERDIPELAELIREHARYERAEEVRPDLQMALRAWLFSQHPRTHVLVAARDEDLIGYASWSLEASTWQASEYAHLDCLYLRGTTRGHGIGRALMNAVKAIAHAAGAMELQWQTPEWNTCAISFYRRTGAREATTIRYTLALTRAP
jgi:GNAT superfamily N-acetyltransferase